MYTHYNVTLVTYTLTSHELKNPTTFAVTRVTRIVLVYLKSAWTLSGIVMSTLAEVLYACSTPASRGDTNSTLHHHFIYGDYQNWPQMTLAS